MSAASLVGSISTMRSPGSNVDTLGKKDSSGPENFHITGRTSRRTKIKRMSKLITAGARSNVMTIRKIGFRQTEVEQNVSSLILQEFSSGDLLTPCSVYLM